MTLAEVAAATDGQVCDVSDEVAVTAPATVDSRAVLPGGLFVALPGEHVDGADFAPAALASGAVAVLVDRRLGVPAVLVPDVVAALGQLARACLDRLPAVTVVGVTGSAGKTGTKDLLAGLLAGLGPTVSPAGSRNNEIGLPLTVLAAEPATRYLVLEYSARGVGHIAQLAAVAPPRIATVLNVGSAHVGVFGSRAAIAQAKGELLEALPADGVAVLNADDPLVLAMAPRTPARVIPVGTGPDAEVAAREIRLGPYGQASFRLVTPVGSAAVQLALYGEHQVLNALAAAAVALELGLGLPATAAGLTAARPVSRWRMEVRETPSGVTVINDAYNANPESMRAALRALVAIAHPDDGPARRGWAVLGEMAELGDSAPAEHRAVGRLAGALGVDRVIAIGPAARPIAEAAAAAGVSAEAAADVAEAVERLQAQMQPGDVVLTKASRAAGLERVAAHLLGAAATSAAPGTAAGRPG